MISEQDGALVWFHPLPAGESATNFQVQSYEGQPVLTWWQGRILEVGFGQGEDVIYNTSYQPVAYVRAGNGYHADLHEIRLTPQGTAWIDAFDPIHLNLSRYHGSADAIVNDSVVQEIDVKTGLVMWEWHALGHIALSESHNPCPARTATRGTTCTSTRSAQGRGARRKRRAPISPATCCCPRATPGRCMTWTSTLAPSVALGRPRLELPSRPRHALLLAARRRMAARWADLGVRQRLRSAQGEAVARPAAGPQHGQPHRDPPQAVRQPDEDAARLQSGQPASSLARRQLADGLRRAAELHRVQRLRAQSCSTARSARTCRTSGPTSRPGTRIPASTPSIAVAGARRRRRDGRRRAGTARPKSPPGRCSPAPPRAPWRLSRRPEARLSDHHPLPATRAYVAVQALSAAGTAIGRSPTVKG